jgi:MFS family permease
VPSTFAALRVRNYRLYWLGLVCYVLGHRAEYVTFGWLVWEVTREPLYLGYLGLAQGVPLIVFQLFGGVLADRTDRVRLLLVTQVLTALKLTLAFTLTVLGFARVEHLLALAALSSIFRAFDEPTRMSLVPQLVDRARLPNAIALGSIPWQASRIIGPSVTGILIAAFGGGVGLGLAALCSWSALVLYGRLHVPHTASAHGHRRMWPEMMEGVRFVARDFVFAALVCLALFNVLFGLSYVTLLPIFADVYYGAGSVGYGVLQAAHGAGALIGTLTIATMASRIRRPGRALLVGATVMGLTLMLFSYAPVIGLALAVLPIVGFSNTFYLTQVSTFLQQKVPDHLRGRVMSLYSLCWNLLPLGGLIGGALAAAVDARFAVFFGGAMVAANALIFMMSRRLKTIA